MLEAQVVIEHLAHLSSLLITHPQCYLDESDSWKVIKLINNGMSNFTETKNAIDEIIVMAKKLG